MKAENLELPQVITDLIKAQNEKNTINYAALFTEDAVVHDENEVHTGTEEIMSWNKSTNDRYQTILKPTDIINTENGAILTVNVSGTFPGSPINLAFTFTFEGEKISSLDIG